MADFMTVTTTGQPLDPHKRVNYTFGLVLGVDEFQQEQLYHLEKHRLHNRLLHGYGTACGLKVSRRGTTDEIEVSAGIALNPRGEEIRVEQLQCGKLNAWLARHGSTLTVTDGYGTVYVTLCYRDCLTDDVPIPGEPCRTPEESMAPSRIADDFTISFSKDAPPQPEENGVRRMGDLLRRIVVTDDEADAAYISMDDLLAMVRGLAVGPAPTTPIYVLPGRLEPMLRTAFRVWVTEVRPLLVRPGEVNNCLSDHADDRCVLLARLAVPLTTARTAVDTTRALDIHEDERPYLLHTRMLQEWLLTGASMDDDSDDLLGVVHMTDANRVRVWITHPALLDATEREENIFKLFIDESASPTILKSIKRIKNTNVWELTPTEKLEPGQRLRVEVDLQTLSVNEVTLAVLSRSGDDYLDRDGNIVTLYGVVPILRLDDLIDVNAPSPAEGDVLTFKDRVWVNARPTGGGGTPQPDPHPMPLVTITFEGDFTTEGGDFWFFKAWFHLTNQADPSESNLPELVKDFGVRVFQESDSPTPFITDLQARMLQAHPLTGVDTRNVVYIAFDKKLSPVPDYLRFVFDISSTPMRDPSGGGMRLLEWMEKLGIKWHGFDGKSMITAFWEQAEEGEGQDAVGPQIVAAGSFSFLNAKQGDLLPELRPSFGNLTAQWMEFLDTRAVIHLKFSAFRPSAHYITTGTILFFNFEFDQRGINPIIAASPEQKEAVEIYIAHPILIGTEIMFRNLLGFMVQIVELPNPVNPDLLLAPVAVASTTSTATGRTPQSTRRRQPASKPSTTPKPRRRRRTGGTQ